MAGLSPFTSVFRAHPAPDSHRVTRRSRQTISCAQCRARKLRCDRQQPCGSCTRRGQSDSCVYSPTPAPAPVPVPAAASVAGDVRRTRTAADGLLTRTQRHQHQPQQQKQQQQQQQQPRQEVQLRLQKLERMVQDLLGTTAASNSRPGAPQDDGGGNPSGVSDRPVARAGLAGPSPSPSASPSDSSPGVGGGGGGGGIQPVYHGATHWAAFLDDIREIQVVLSAEGPDGMSYSGSPAQCCALSPSGPDMFLGGFRAIDMDTVLASLPRRQDADFLVATYFGAKYTAVPFVHVRHFQREYEAFWASPRSASFLWISMLFAILATASIVVRAKGLERAAPAAEPRTPAFYNAKAAECLVAGQYLKNRRYAIEALLLHAHAGNIASRDSDSVLWAIFGLATRLAQRAGYHRDPVHLLRQGRMTPFEAEMRRRVWFFVETFDLLLSFQLGMPPIVHGAECDAAEPGNHPDDDFDENTAVMPAPRSPLDATPALYYSYKARLCRVLRRVIRHALRVDREAPHPPSDSSFSSSPSSSSSAAAAAAAADDDRDTRALHDELSAWKDALPACLRLTSIRACSFADEPYVIMHRLLLDLMHCKALCVLFRPYLGRDRAGDPRSNDAFRRVCRDAALRMLNLQFEFDAETRPGGRLYHDRWMLSSLTLHDFKIAAMVLCLDLNGSAGDAGSACPGPDRARTIETLRTARSIWSERAADSQDAKRASAVLGAMLRRLTDAEPPEPSLARPGPEGAAPTEGWSESTLDGMGDMAWPLTDAQGQDLVAWPFSFDDMPLDGGMYSLATPGWGES